MHGTKRTAKNKPLIMWWWGVGDGEAVSSHRCFSLFSPPPPCLLSEKAWLQSANTGYVSSLRLWGSDNNTPQFRLWVSPEEGLTEKCRVLRDISRSSLTLSPAKSLRGFLADIYWENLNKLLEVNLTVLRGPYECVPLEVWMLRLVYNEPPEICWLQFGSSAPGAGCFGDSGHELLLR